MTFLAKEQQTGSRASGWENGKSSSSTQTSLGRRVRGEGRSSWGATSSSSSSCPLPLPTPAPSQPPRRPRRAAFCFPPQPASFPLLPAPHPTRSRAEAHPLHAPAARICAASRPRFQPGGSPGRRGALAHRPLPGAAPPPGLAAPASPQPRERPAWLGAPSEGDTRGSVEHGLESSKKLEPRRITGPRSNRGRKKLMELRPGSRAHKGFGVACAEGQAPAWSPHHFSARAVGSRGIQSFQARELARAGML
ncbi:formin-like protein 5 [Sus scrofa]|uniref:formin-like protein 5 n=1 Tax=Sus scrofa TaxID=9823 RepID=UPI000A2B2963|nr:formin-like protein 5 [Sus scrofa]